MNFSQNVVGTVLMALVKKCTYATIWGPTVSVRVSRVSRVRVSVRVSVRF